MRPELHAFADEFALIKVAAGEEPIPPKALVKRMLTYLPAGALGAGLGVGAAYAVKKKVLPHILPGMSTKQRMAVAVGAGMLSGVFAKKLRDATMKREDAPYRRNN